MVSASVVHHKKVFEQNRPSINIVQDKCSDKNIFARPIGYLKKMKLLSFNFYYVVKSLTGKKLFS